MKRTMSISLLAVFTLLLLATCFSPWQGDDGTITVFIGGDGRVAWSGIDTDDLEHRIKATDSSGRVQNKTIAPGVPTVLFTSLSAGPCEVIVEGWLDGEPISRGVATVNVEPGKNATVAITMFNPHDAEDFGPEAVITTINVSSANEWAAAKTTISNSGNDKNYIINVTAGFVEIAADPDPNTFGNVIGIKVSLRGVGRTLALDESNIGKLLLIGDEQTVILRGLTLRGNKLNEASLVTMKDDATFIMRSGKISGNSGNMSRGGGVYMEDGTFTMYGGEISGNNAITGGGVAVAGGIFTMNGGTISGNNGGGNGGGVAVAGGTFTMNGGTISGNIGQDAGGGVHLSSGTLTMNGGTISGNNTDSGGGVFMDSGTFTMHGGTIFDNTSSYSGGGMYMNNGTFTMYHGTISDNHATDGGGLYITGENAIFTMHGGTISGNNGGGNGGGVAVLGGTFTMHGGTISGNITEGRGGGVFVVDFGTFQIVTGTIYGSDKAAGIKNTASLGAALCVSEGTAQRGRFSGTTWNSSGNLDTTDDTIRVKEGEFQ